MQNAAITCLYVGIRLGLIAITALYFHRVLSPKGPFLRTLSVLGIVMAAFRAVYLLWPPTYLLSSNAAPVLSVLVFALETAAMLFSLRLLTRSRWAEILLFYSLSLLISVGSSLLLFALSSLFSGETVSTLVATRWNDLFSLIITAVLEMSLLFGISEAAVRYLKKQGAELRLSQFTPVFGSQVASMAILAVLMREGDLFGRMMPAACALLLLYGIADAVLIHSFRAFVKNSELQYEVGALQKMQALQKAYYLSMDAQLKVAQRMRHDYRNVLQTLDYLIARGEAERARNLLSEHCESLSGYAAAVHTGSEILDAVLTMKAHEAEKRSVPFSTELLLPDPLTISDADLMSIFSNLLDNALEYVETLPEAEKRFVGVSGEVRGGLWVLTFFNTYPYAEPPRFETTKADRAAHGHGVEIVKSIVQKYGGTFSADAGNGTLFIRLTLNPEISLTVMKGKRL